MFDLKSAMLYVSTHQCDFTYVFVNQISFSRHGKMHNNHCYKHELLTYVLYEKPQHNCMTMTQIFILLEMERMFPEELKFIHTAEYCDHLSLTHSHILCLFYSLA